MEKRVFYIASDHGGYELKELIKKYIATSYQNVELTDLGCDSEASVDFPDYAEKACKEILKNENNKGVLICGSGIGISIAANKFKGIRCALCHDYFTAKISRVHNNANVVAFGGRVVGLEVAKSIIDGFMEGEFNPDPKYQRRNDKMDTIQKNYS